MTTESTTAPFGERNATASNMCGFTLMNNQVGTIIAEVLSQVPSVKVEHLPSMIRVDGEGKFELVYADVDEAAGEDEDWFGASEFEENM
ncbi:MAG: propane monooxygenase coupling protein, partial [Actinomycetota bacterium]|nr:propane monooxygenase coupling protein [Actinomycetota bacterium]